MISMPSCFRGGAVRRSLPRPAIRACVVPAGMTSGAGGRTTPDYPFGATFTGRAWSEPVLLRLAYAFEQASTARRIPPSLPPLEPGCVGPANAASAPG